MRPCCLGTVVDLDVVDWFRDEMRRQPALELKEPAKKEVRNKHQRTEMYGQFSVDKSIYNLVD